MRVAIVHTGQRYTVESGGNGVYVVIHRNADGADVGLQGDEATDFLDELDAATEHRRGGGDDLCADYDEVMRVHPQD